MFLFWKKHDRMTEKTTFLFSAAGASCRGYAPILSSFRACLDFSCAPILCGRFFVFSITSNFPHDLMKKADHFKKKPNIL